MPAWLRAAIDGTAGAGASVGEDVPIKPQVARSFELVWWSLTLVDHLGERARTFDEWLVDYTSEPLPRAGGVRADLASWRGGLQNSAVAGEQARCCDSR